jgi:hypothetical protein
VFFLSWVCYSVAISTVFQAYFTSYVIEPGYEETIKIVDQMSKFDRKFGYVDLFKGFFSESYGVDYSENFKEFVACPDFYTSIKWATDYHNFSTIVDDFTKEIWRAGGMWTDENNRPLLCEMEGGDVTKLRIGFAVRNGRFILECINGVIDRIIETGINIHAKGQFIQEVKLKNRLSYPAIVDTYIDINVRHMQPVFYILLLGYSLAVASFVVEIMWYVLMSRGLFLQAHRLVVDENQYTELTRLADVSLCVCVCGCVRARVCVCVAVCIL